VPDAEGRLVFKANARTVVLDVVVTGKNGRPVEGLHKEEFLVSEDGQPQKITTFEEHTAPESAQATAPALPPDIFTNIPPVKLTDSVTVLLLDSLNTQLQDQSFVRKQMLKYLKGLQPGRRIAIFTLGNQLRFIQGFTTDPELLIAALNNQKSGAGLQSSPLLRTNGDIVADKQVTALLAQTQAQEPSAATAAALAALQQFQAEQVASQTGLRAQMTLRALQQLAHYLAGIPGRKNVIWCSSAFPLNLFPNPDLRDSFAVERSYDEEVRKTDALLTSAEVSIYPVAAEGLNTDTLFNADQGANAIMAQPSAGTSQSPQANQKPVSPENQMQQGEINSLQTDSVQRNANHTTMDVIARDTGGEAIYNTNGLNDALARVVDHGSRFYTLTYTPTNTASDGQYRRIQIKLADGNYKLAYRRGYFATSPKTANASASQPGSDPLHPFMGPGMPDSTQIPLALRVLRGATAGAADPALLSRDPSSRDAAKSIAGDNRDLKGPLTRYSVDFVVAARGLQLEPTPNGGRHGAIETTLLVYDRDGRALNWMVRELDLTMDAARFAQVKANGVNFREEIDVPKTGVFLRGGVYDQSSGLAGTIEIPFDSVVALPAAAAKTQ
jgi:VWFA-related protein